MSKSVIVKSLLAAGALLAVQAGLSEVLAEKATVIELTQTGCQFPRVRERPRPRLPDLEEG